MAYLNATDIARYWSAISEAERQELVKDVRGSIEYGSSVIFQRLPDAAKFKVQAAYARTMKADSRETRRFYSSRPALEPEHANHSGQVVEILGYYRTDKDTEPLTQAEITAHLEDYGDILCKVRAADGWEGFAWDVEELSE